MTNERIDTSVSITIHPQTVDAYRGAFVLGTNIDGSPVIHDAFNKARAAMEVLFTRSMTMAEAERAMKSAAAQQADPSQERRLRAGASRSLSECRKTVETTLEALAGHRAKVADDIFQGLGIPVARTSVTDSQRASDVRSALRAMSKSDRLSAMRAAVREGDSEAVASVLSASPLASGLSSGEMDGLRAEAEQKFTPEAAAMRDNLDRLSEVIARSGNITERRFGPLVGQGDSPGARAERAISALEGGAA